VIIVDKYLKGEGEKLVPGEFQGGRRGASGGTAPELVGEGWDRERADGLGRCADDAVSLSTS